MASPERNRVTPTGDIVAIPLRGAWTGNRGILHEARWPTLPEGTFVHVAGRPTLVLDEAVVPWSVNGYGPPRPRPTDGTAQVITPPSTVAALAHGYRPQIDAAALIEGG